MPVNENKYSLIWAERELSHVSLPTANVLPHFENYCSDTIRRYRFTSKHVRFPPFRNWLVTWSLPLHLLCLFDLHFSASLFLQEQRPCNCLRRSRCSDKQVMNTCHLFCGWKGEGKQEKNPHFPDLRSFQVTFETKPKVQPLCTVSTIMTCAKASQTILRGEFCQAAANALAQPTLKSQPVLEKPVTL